MQGGAYAAPYQAPQGGIRHAYPLTVTSASFTSAFLLNLRTLPYAFVRFFVHLFHAIVAVSMIVGSIATAVVVGQRVHPYAGIAVFFAGMIAYGALWAWWFRYVLYAIKCGHVAVLIDLVTRGKVGDGTEGQLAYGRRVVRERLGDVAQVYVMQSLVRGVVGEFNMGLGFIGDFMPLDLGVVLTFGRKLLRASTRYLDETLFAYSLLRRNDPLWDACSEGLGYYFQNSKEILKTSVWMMLINVVLRFLMWIAFTVGWGIVLYSFALAVCSVHTADVQSLVGPGASTSDAAQTISAGVGILGGIVAAGLTIHALEHAFLHPIYLTMVMTKFLIVIQSQPLDPGFAQSMGSPRMGALRNVVSQIDASRGRP